MRQAGVLTRVLPESEKWGIDLIHPLVKAEADLDWPADPLLRLEALLPLDPDRAKALAERLKLSTAEGARLEAWALQPSIAPKTIESGLARMLYGGNRQAVLDRLRLSLAVARGKALADDKAMIEAGHYSRLIRFAEKWQKPKFPLKGGDLTALGLAPGATLGAALKKLEGEWIASGFTLDRAALLGRAASGISKSQD
jgi:tRNA nucleotidyltransferase/poly(A) polymerase